MPLYDYHCEKCGETREYLVPRVGTRPESCLECGSKDLTKVFGERPFGVQVGDANVYVVPEETRPAPQEKLTLLIGIVVPKGTLVQII